MEDVQVEYFQVAPLRPPFHSEAMCKATDMEMILLVLLLLLLLLLLMNH